MSSSHDITLTPQEQALIMRLKSFRVPEMAHILEEQLKDPNNQYLLCFEYLSLHILCTGRYKIGHHFPKFCKLF